MRLIPLLFVLLLASCSSFGVYKMDVYQGNYITHEMVAKLSPGMTREQVKSILGTPLIADMFHANRWDYVFRHRDGQGQVTEKKLVVFFDQDSMVKVEGDSFADDAPRISTEEKKGLFSRFFGGK